MIRKISEGEGIDPWETTGKERLSQEASGRRGAGHGRKASEPGVPDADTV